MEAGARAVVEQLPKDGKAPTVGVLATVGTCSSNAYPKAIARGRGPGGQAGAAGGAAGQHRAGGGDRGKSRLRLEGAGERPVPYAGPQRTKSRTHEAEFGRQDYARFDAMSNWRSRRVA